MAVEALILIFNILFFINNLFYLNLVEKIFGVHSKKRKRIAFSFTSGIVGTIMLVLFGSMSALGYCIMLVVYIITVMLFYREHGFASRLACALSFNIHIMVMRAILSSVLSMATGYSIYELSSNQTYFWFVLILTTISCTILTMVISQLAPKKYLCALGKQTEYLYLYIAIAVLANIYMIANGNVYIHEITYEWLPIHQLIAAIVWLLATYVGVVTLAVMDHIRMRKEMLEKDSIYKHVITSRSLALLEINCTQDRILRMLRYGKDEPILKTSYTQFITTFLFERMPPEELEDALNNESTTAFIEAYNRGETELTYKGRIHMHGELRWVRTVTSMKKDEKTGNIIAVMNVTDDIHETMEKEQALQFEAERDLMTGMLNKKATEHYIELSFSKGLQGALLMIDLDNFKAINDTFGHAYGDYVLKEVGESILGSFRSDDIVGRVGGDEFMVFAKNCTSISEIAKRAEIVRRRVQKEYFQDGVSVKISCSIGISIQNGTLKGFKELYQEADMAMYVCKNNQKNGFAFFENE